MLRSEPVALLIFGANRLPKTERAFGKGIREFREALTGKDDPSDNEKKYHDVN